MRKSRNTNQIEEIWNKIKDLDLVISNITDEKLTNVRSSSKKASEYRNKAEVTKKEAEARLEQIKKYEEEIKEICEKQKQYGDDIEEVRKRTEIQNENIIKYVDEITTHHNNVEQNISSLEESLNQREYIEEEISELKSSMQKGKSTLEDIESARSSLIPKYEEINDFYNQIFGDKSQDGWTEGIKEDLENAYDEIKEKVNRLEHNIATIEDESIGKYRQYITEKNESYKASSKQWETKYNDIIKKLEDLLPRALTTGLSHAYSSKRKQEEGSLDKYSKGFRRATYGMVAVSLIPFMVSIYMLVFVHGNGLEEVIMNTPRMVLSIMPLYVPVLWLAYSSNRKMNLSKRLIEEYTHKEVLSKTYEGLSTQIHNINDESVSGDLRIKLMYNILSVSSENPGKLITDYNKTDHPLMDALDKSVKLANAVDKLTRIPGMGTIAKVIDKRSKKILDKETEKSEQGMEALEEMR